MKKIISIICVFAIFLTGCSSTSTNEPINIYTSRDYEVDKLIYENFTAETGIPVNVVELESDELITRVIAEKDNPQADIIVVNGAQYIYELNEAGILQSIDSSAIDSGVDKQFYGDNFVGLTHRARIVAYDPEEVKPEQVDTYAELTDESLEGEVLVRSSTNSYNQALTMNMIQNQGYEATLEWATGLVNNFTREPEGGDRDQIKAIYADQGSVAITNSYYYFQMLNSDDPEEVKAAESVEIVFPTDAAINMTWLGVTSKGSENSSVNEYISYVTSPEVQALYASESGEFPTNSVADYGQLEVYRDFTYQPVDFETLGMHTAEAQEIFTTAGWN